MPDPRQRLIDATLELVRRDGVAAASARSIAREGGFSQALVFYHFESVEDLLAAASDAGSREMIARWSARLDAVESMAALVDLAEDLHRDEEEAGNVTVLAQFLAASHQHPRVAAATGAALDRWAVVLEPTLERLLGDSPVADLLDAGDLARLVSDAFVGIELVGSTRGPDALQHRLDGLRHLALLVDRLDELGPAASRAIRTWASRDPAQRRR